MLLDCNNNMVSDTLYETLIMKQQKKNNQYSLCMKIKYKNKEHFETKIPW